MSKERLEEILKESPFNQHTEEFLIKLKDMNEITKIVQELEETVEDYKAANKELEEIKELFEIHKIQTFADRKTIPFNLDDIEWLIKQAERVEELEELLIQEKYDKNLFNARTEEWIKMKQQNQRYREALNFGVEYLKNSDIRQVQLVVTALKSALEGEE